MLVLLTPLSDDGSGKNEQRSLLNTEQSSSKEESFEIFPMLKSITNKTKKNNEETNNMLKVKHLLTVTYKLVKL